MREVPLEDLIDVASLRSDGRAPTPQQIREALPRGWAYDAKSGTAFRDGRLLFRDGWVLIVGLVSFGAVGLGLFWTTFPSGWRGISRFLSILLIVAIAGGVVGPMITRALSQRGSR